jgi:hypothetical protein
MAIKNEKPRGLKGVIAKSLKCKEEIGPDKPSSHGSFKI